MRLLTGWKEIAGYLNYGIRTVQRWELLGLPIHRIKASQRSPVIAFAEELDVWAQSSHVRTLDMINELMARVALLEADVRSLQRERRQAKEGLPMGIIAKQKSDATKQKSN